MTMEIDKKIAGACGEIEVYIPDKKDENTSFTFFESMLMTA